MIKRRCFDESFYKLTTDNKKMQKEESKSLQEFRSTLNRIDWLFHIKEFKSVSQSKISHLKPDKRYHPSDYYVQMRRLLLHMIYLYYVSYLTKTDFYLYPHICINKWETIFYYFSLNQESEKFMIHINHQDFKQNVRQHFVDIWNIKMPQQEAQQEEMEDKSPTENHPNNHNKKGNSQHKNPWTQFADMFVEIFSENYEITPKDIIFKLQQTKHMKDNVLIVGVLSSTILPCIKFNKTVEKFFRISYEEEPSIMNKIFDADFSNEGTKDFVNCIIRFFKVLNDFKILGITTTISDKSNAKTQDDESLLTEFYLSLGRPWVQTQYKLQNSQLEDKNPSSGKSSEHDYSQGSESKFFGQIKCQYFWSKRLKPRQLTFRVTISINKKIYPLYFEEIESIWHKLTTKWKVILDENKQLSSFNPGFIFLSYNRDSYQLSLTEYVKCQPFQNSLSQLILTTDKLIIATLVMKDIISFYEKKSVSVQITEENLNLNDGRLQDIARSVCQSIKNYHNYSVQILNETQMKKYQ